MVKKALIVVSIVAILLALAFTYVAARFVDKAAIARAEVEMKQLRGQRDSLKQFVDERTAQQMILDDSSRVSTEETNVLRKKVQTLELQRAQQQLAIRSIPTPEALQKRLATTFPEVAASAWGIFEVRNDEEDIEIQYLRMPLWFAETFIIDHQNSRNYAAQRDSLKKMDELQQQTIALRNRILALEKEKTTALQKGYDSAYTKFAALNDDYVKLLKNPRMSLKWTGPVTVLGSAAAGLLLGVAVQ